MYVVVIPPREVGRGYVIARDQPSFSFATADGLWVGFLKSWREAIQFSTQRDAIEFAETHGWTVMNKKDDDSLIDVPTGGWL